jgi:hypothetical protein
MAIPVPASVLFLRLRAFHEQPVAAQARRRAALQEAARQALAPWREEQRVVLEAPDGLAIVGRGDPALALQAAQQAAAACGDEDVAIGLHYGPVKAEADTVGGARLAGEGLETAAAVAAFADQHPLLASQAFRDALAAGSPRRARALRSAGDFVDARMLSRPLYAFDPAAARRRAVWGTLFGLAGVALLLGAGYAGRTVRLEMEAAARPAVIVIEIKPAGEVWIDGELKGTAPPLARLSLPAGPHSIELRSGKLKPVNLDVHLQPGEEMELKHTFVTPVASAAPRRAAAPQSTQAKAIDKVKSWLDKLK